MPPACPYGKNLGFRSHFGGMPAVFWAGSSLQSHSRSSRLSRKIILYAAPAGILPLWSSALNAVNCISIVASGNCVEKSGAMSEIAETEAVMVSKPVDARARIPMPVALRRCELPEAKMWSHGPSQPACTSGAFFGDEKPPIANASFAIWRTAVMPLGAVGTKGVR
jgi:hypothetical protein